MEYEEILNKASAVIAENDEQMNYWIECYTKAYDNRDEKLATVCWEQVRYYNTMNTGIYKLLKAMESCHLSRVFTA